LYASKTRSVEEKKKRGGGNDPSAVVKIEGLGKQQNPHHFEREFSSAPKPEEKREEGGEKSSTSRFRVVGKKKERAGRTVSGRSA